MQKILISLIMISTSLLSNNNMYYQKLHQIYNDRGLKNISNRYDVSKYLFIDVNPIMPKAALKHMGVIESDMLRQPLIPTTEENKNSKELNPNKKALLGNVL